MKLFKKSELVNDNFIVRKKFWGGVSHDPQLIDEFNRNIESSPFVLCNRGGGNFSMRFYQTLAFGRMPVLVNTDMLLPFENQIRCNDFVIFEKSEKECLKKVIEVSKFGKVEEMQTRSREIFDQYYSPEAFGHLLMQSVLIKP